MYRVRFPFPDQRDLREANRKEKEEMNGWLGFHDPHKFGRIPDPPEPPEGDPEIEVGDWLECNSKYDMVDTMMRLADEDIETEYRFERNGMHGYWLEVIAIG